MSAPHPRPLAWVVGAGGLVGRHVTAELGAAGHEVLTTTVPWHDEAATVRVLVDAVGRVAEARRGRSWVLAWCAGAGVVATSEQELATEVRVFERVAEALAASVGAGEDGV